MYLFLKARETENVDGGIFSPTLYRLWSETSRHRSKTWRDETPVRDSLRWFTVQLDPKTLMFLLKAIAGLAPPYLAAVLTRYGGRPISLF